MTVAAALAAFVAGLAADVVAQPLQPRSPGRVRPSDSVTCPRDRLTAYTDLTTDLPICKVALTRGVGDHMKVNVDGGARR